MHSSRKILIKHFTARAAEYDKDIAISGSVEDKQPSTAKTEDPVGLHLKPLFIHTIQRSLSSAYANSPALSRLRSSDGCTRAAPYAIVGRTSK